MTDRLISCSVFRFPLQCGFQATSAVSHCVWAAAGTLQIAGRKAAVLICYEQLLIWPVLTSFREHPDLLVGIANDYWARSTSVPDIQWACVTSWARLFHVPILWAENT